jgi:tetratricopeptide (TPR) repeat protein
VAIGLLEGALAKDRDDIMAWRAKASLLARMDRRAEALAAFEALLERTPNADLVLGDAGRMALSLGQREKAVKYLKRAAAANPFEVAHRRKLADLLAAQGDWAGCREQTQAWLRLDPFSIDARRLAIHQYIREKKKDKAKAEMATIRRLGPPNLSELETEFAGLLRKLP